MKIMMNGSLYNLLQKLEIRKKEFISEIKNNPETIQLYKPDRNGWNMVQVAEHCYRIETGVMRMLAKNNERLIKKAGIAEGFRSILLSIFLKSPIRFKTPPVSGILPEGKLSLDEIKAEWDKTGKQLKDFVEAFPEENLPFLIFKHPLSGKHNLIQTIKFIYDHLGHHMAQVSRIKKQYLKSGKFEGK